MTLDKAIELLKTASEGWPMRDNEDYYKALDLGIEALIRLKEQRHRPNYLPPMGPHALLLGETKE